MKNNGEMREYSAAVIGCGQIGGGIVLANLYPGYMPRNRELYPTSTDYRLPVRLDPRYLVVRPVKGRTPNDEDYLDFNAYERAVELLSAAVYPVTDPRHQGVRPGEHGNILIGERGLPPQYETQLILADVSRDAPISWSDDNIDVVIETTGYLGGSKKPADIQRGVGSYRGLVYASYVLKKDGSDVDAQYVIEGVNAERFKPRQGLQVISGASCTTAATAQGASALARMGKSGIYYDVYTVHAYTPSQEVGYRPGKGSKGRDIGAVNEVGSNVTAGIAVLFPELKFKPRKNRSFRVPTLRGSVAVLSVGYDIRRAKRLGIDLDGERIREVLQEHADAYPQAAATNARWNDRFNTDDIYLRPEMAVFDLASVEVTDVSGRREVEFFIYYPNVYGSIAKAYLGIDVAMQARNRAPDPTYRP